MPRNKGKTGRCASGLALSLISNHYSLINFSCPRQLKFHVEAAVVAGAVAHVDPAAAFLVDALVNWEVEALDQGQQAAVAGRRTDGDVGGLAALVLAAGRTAHDSVQSGTAVAAVHVDGSAPGVAQRVKDVVHEGVQGLDGAGGRHVVDAQTGSGV